MRARHDVLGVELDVEPRAAIGNDARREQQLARGVGLALVVVEEHARRTVHLRNDDALPSLTMKVPFMVMSGISPM